MEGKEMDKVNIDSLVIEVTRKCQLQCSHCLRGDAEAIDIKPEYIDLLLSKVGYISSVTFTGGEPSLNVGAIDYFIQQVEHHQVTVGNFYIATNAVTVSDEFLLAIMRLWLLCDENEISQVAISNDGYHADEIEDSTQSKKLECFKFTSNKYNAGEWYDGISEGRNEGSGRDPKDHGFEIEDDEVREGEVYLNCKGEIISGCDWSYESQPKHKVCNVQGMTLDSFASYKQ